MPLPARFAAAMLTASLSAPAAAQTAPAPTTPRAAAAAAEVARLLQGRLIIGGTTFYRVAGVRAVDDSEGALSLHADVDALLPADYGGNPHGTDARGRLYYDVRLAGDARCGVAAAASTLDTADFLVFDGSEFVTPREFVEQLLPGRTVAARERPINRIAPAVLARVQDCARRMHALADAMPFRRIALNTSAGKPLLDIRRTTLQTTTYTEDLGEETIARLAYVEIEPRDGAVADYAVELRSVSVMRCDYEGPHIELLDWKRGLSEPLRLPREGNRFLLPPGALDDAVPAFPDFQRDELRGAIARFWGEAGLAAEEQATPCAPFLGARLLTVRRRGEVVHEVLLRYPGGC